MAIEAINTARIQAQLPENVIVGNLGAKGRPQANEDAQPQSTKQSRQKAQISHALLEALSNDMETLHHVGLQFSVHKETGQTVVRVVDKDSGKLIRQIPPQELLDLAAKLEDMMGILFDKQV